MSSKVIMQQSQPAIYVYEAPLRIWHWVNALALVALMINNILGTNSVTP